ncbi:MAG: cobalt ECF transporter T component CbiQ [Lachnotalea sp.]
MQMQFQVGNKHKTHKIRRTQTLNMDKFAVNSGLAYINPELKLMVGIASLIICLMSKTGIVAIMVAIAMIVVTLRYGKVNFNDYCHMIFIPFSFIILSGIVLLVDISKSKMGYIDIWIYVRYLSITKASLMEAVLVSTRAFCGVCCLYMISLSTPLYEIIGVLQRCKVPEIVIELMYLIYRFIFILLETYHNMKTAAETRLGYINLKRSYQSIFGICSNLLVIAFKKASRSFDAMEARCYDGKLKFIEREKTITVKQKKIAGAYFIVIITMSVLERICK